MLPLFRRIHRSLVSFQYHKTLVTSSSSSSSSSSLVDSRVGAPSVAVFWDLDNKPPKSIHPYDAAVRLRLAASSLGPLRFVAAYATPHALRNVPAPVCASRLEDSATSVPHICRVCGRKFFVHSKLLNHFKIHEREHAKRLRRLDSATGGRYVRLKAQLNLKMDKYRKVAKEILIPRVGYGLGDELQRAGVSVRIVEDRPEAADRALREHMVETMDRRRVGCLVLVSDDTGFVGVIREARMRCLKTVVVGDDGDGALKRCADASFSWKEVVSGKARKEAASSVLKWNDKDLLKKLEWRYVPELEPKEKEYSANAWEDIDSGDESTFDGCEDLMGCEVCSTLVAKEDGEEETTSLRQKLEQVMVLQDTLDQEKSGIISKKKKDDKLVLTETIHGSSEELPNNKCIICFFGNHINHSYLKPKESIVLCEDCKFKIASFYMLHVQKWHELLSPRSKKKVYGFAGKKERSPSRASSCRTGRGGRRRLHQTTRKKAGRSYQQILRQRYEAGDPTGPLGQPSGKFDYLVEYSMAELGRNSFNMPYDDLFSPTGWGDAE